MSPEHGSGDGIPLCLMGVFPVYGTLGTFTWRLLATVLGGQALVLFFAAQAARGLSVADGGSGAQTRLWVGIALATLSLVAAGSMRRPFGVTLGWLVQVLTWAAALVLPAMIGVGLVFTGLWVLLLVQGQRADRLMAGRAATPPRSSAPGTE